MRASGARGTARGVGPTDRGTVRLGRVGCCEHDRARLVRVRRAERTHPVDRARQRELRGAEPGDEPTAAGAARFLQRAQHGVHRGETAGHTFGAHAFTGHHAVPFEQLQGLRVRDLGAARRGLEQRRDQ